MRARDFLGVAAAAGLVLSACDAVDEPVGEGTEIGDEGSGICMEEMTPVSDGSAEIAALGDSPEGLLGDACGAFASAEAELSLTATGEGMVWVDNEPLVYEDGYVPDEEAECSDFLYVPLEVSLDAEALEMWSRIADVTFWDDGRVSFRAGALVHQGDPDVDPNDDEGGGDEGGDGDGSDYWGEGASLDTSLEPSGFVVEDMFSVVLVLDGELVDGRWELTAWWMAESYPEGADGTVSSYEETAWTGVVDPT